MTREPTTCAGCHNQFVPTAADKGFITCPACRRPDKVKRKTKRYKGRGSGNRTGESNNPWLDNVTRGMEDRT